MENVEIGRAKADKRIKKLIAEIMLSQKINEIKEFINDFEEQQKEWEGFISGFSSEAHKYETLIEFLNRLIELEKQDLERRF